MNRFGIGLHLPLQLIDQLRKQFFLPCHLAAHFLHHGGNLRRIAAAELLGEHIADGIEVIGRSARGNANAGILVDALRRDGDHQGGGVGQRHQLDAL